ncbi:glycosyltransferase family 39 protein [Paraferrimonas sp. SM1919]|uniref:ArnT family glycosyltransferase n=1 Tax=Paraferrimonas sp. SM1919 TaxID=2662263 RepID=UPI0013D7B156|nr:glycosyltransferase family 39 protein [Paraferrimonas sp. SM1919]
MTLSPRLLWQLLLAIIAVRLISLGLYPLMDTTEARYGEMARLMVDTGNWLTPQFDYNVWFWGKPPLHTWASALGITIFGDNEFAVRFPHWLAGIATLALTFYVASKQGINAMLTAVMLASTAIFMIASGAVMTDMLLTLGMTLAMVGFYLGWQGQYKWGYLAFVGLAIGLLAKGPLIIVLMGIAVFPWMVIQHGVIGAFVELWKRFPLISGTALMALIAVPWYLIAEQATPGFIEYFIVGEHYLRFVVSGWEGDLYGSAHSEAKGKIWLFWLYSALPWSAALPILFYKRKAQLQQNMPAGWLSFLIWWMISPLILFTFAGNILPAYVLPGIPALALLCASLTKDSGQKWVIPTALITPVLITIALLVLNNGRADEKSDKFFFEDVNIDNTEVFYWGKRPFSGQYYTKGKAIELHEQGKVPENLAKNNEVFGAPIHYVTELEQQTKDYILFVGSWGFDEVITKLPHQCDELKRNGDRVMFMCHPNSVK